MLVSRFIIAGITAVVLLVIPAAAAEPPSSEPSLHDVIVRLDEILQRIERLEKRIGRLESVVFRKPDKHGILRDATGWPIGIWGIDDPRRPASPRR